MFRGRKLYGRYMPRGPKLMRGLWGGWPRFRIYRGFGRPFVRFGIPRFGLLATLAGFLRALAAPKPRRSRYHGGGGDGGD